MKKLILFSIFFLFFVIAPHVLAQGFVPLAPIPGLTQGVTANTSGLATFFNNLYKFAIGLAAALAVIEIIWGGLEISTKDSVSKQSDGRERITQAIFGLVLVLSPVLVFSIINPSILNLSLSLKPIDLTVPPPLQTSATPTLPPCVLGNRPPNCIEAAPTQEGASATPTSGLYCYERKNSGAANDFVCASTFAICDKDYKLESGGPNSYNNSAVSSCSLR